MDLLTKPMISKVKWGDADYYGYYWDLQFSNPTLIVRIAPANSCLQELVAFWATNLNVNLDYKNHVNSLLTWDVSFDELPDERWKVCFDLASHGTLNFECSKLAVRPIQNENDS